MDDQMNDKENDAESSLTSLARKPVSLSYGFLPKVKYDHKSKNCKILSVTYNSKTCEYVIADSRGILAWNKNFASAKTTRLMNFPAYKFNVIKTLLYCRPFNLYFALTQEYTLKIYNLNFHETFSIESDTNALIHMIFNGTTEELITASRSEIHIWNFGQLNKQIDSTTITYGLILKKKWEIENGRLINRISLDEDAQRLYCLSEADIWCYDLTGKLIFIVKKGCSTHLSACVFGSNTLVAGSVDGQVSMLTTSGGKIHTFHSHSNVITEIFIHPSDSHLIISSSLDGYIKLFSMDLLEELYSLKVFNDGIEYMALKSNSLLYCVSTKNIEEFDLNYFCQFWGSLRYPAKSIELIKSNDKPNRVMVIDTDNTVKLFSSNEGKKLCTVLPPPTLDLSNKIMACLHDRDYNLIYLLKDTSEVWVYTIKTDPACFLAFISLWNDSSTKRESLESHSTPNGLRFTQNTLKHPNCCCIEILPDFFEIEFIDGDGNLQTKCNILACGMDNGQLLLYNPVLKGKKEGSLQLCKDPIIQMKFCKEMFSLLVTTKAKTGLIMKLINSNLEVMISIGCDDDISCYAVKRSILASGFSSGHIVMQEMTIQQQKTVQLQKQAPVDHHSGVLAISFHPTLDILCTAGKDSCVKLWSFDKNLLCDITLGCSLTSVCFLNSSGDILIGFKSNIFILRNSEKCSWLENVVDAVDRPESEIYESPHIKFELKRPPSPEPETMENYLVPYNDMMFMILGNWVVQNDDNSSSDSDKRGAITSTLDSDEESFAASDVYQSSFLSRSSIGSIDWALPDCGLTPEGTIVQESEREDEDERSELEIENNEAPEVANADPKFLKSSLPIAEKNDEATIQLKRPSFAHGASRNLKNAKINARQLQVYKKEKKMTKRVRDIDRSQTLSAQNEEKDLALKKETRRVIKKSRKPVDERKRAAGAGRTARRTQSRSDNDDEKLPKTRDDDATSPDGGYVSRLSDTDKLQQTEIENTKKHGVLLVKEPIRLIKSAAKNEVMDGTEMSDHEEENVSLVVMDETNIEIENKKMENESVNGDICIERPRISSAQFFSPSSRASTGISISSENKSISVLEAETPEDELRMVGMISQNDNGNTMTDGLSTPAPETSKFTESVPSSRQSTRRYKIRSLKTSQDIVKTKVVPAYVQNHVELNGKSVNQKSQSKITRSNHGSMTSLAIRPEKVQLRQKKDENQRNKEMQKEESKTKNKEKIEESDSTKKRRGSQAVCVAFGQMLDSEKLLSSSSINLDESKRIVDMNLIEKEEKGPNDVLKFCVSALKRTTKRREKKDEMRMMSADPTEVRRKIQIKNADDLMKEEYRPKTAPTELSKANKVDDVDGSMAANHVGVEQNVIFDQEKDGSKVTSIEYDRSKVISIQDDQPKMRSIQYDQSKMRSIQGDRSKVRWTEDDRSKMISIQDDRPNMKSAEDDESDEEDFKISVTINKSRSDSRHNNNEKSMNEKSEVIGLKTDEIVVKETLFKDSYTHHIEVKQRINRYGDDSIGIYKKIKRHLSNAALHQNQVKMLLNNQESKIDENLKREKSDFNDKNEGKIHSRGNSRFFDSVLKDDEHENADRESKPKDTTKKLTHHFETIDHTGEISDKWIYQEGNLSRKPSKSKMIFVEDREMRDELVEFDVERQFSMSRQEKDKNPMPETIRRMMSPQERLLRRREISANMKKRQESAKFRKTVIEQQRKARVKSGSVSPSYSYDYLIDFLPEKEEELPSTPIYEYHKPEPLNYRIDHDKNDKMQDKSLRARLSGQAFRYGKPIAKDQNEEIIVDFIRTSINRKSDEVVLLPRQNSMPSIPSKCHNYMLVTERKKEETKMSKLERDLLETRFSELSFSVS